jgi:hypothetical protein
MFVLRNIGRALHLEHLGKRYRGQAADLASLFEAFSYESRASDHFLSTTLLRLSRYRFLLRLDVENRASVIRKRSAATVRIPGHGFTVCAIELQQIEDIIVAYISRKFCIRKGHPHEKRGVAFSSPLFYDQPMQ